MAKKKKHIDLSTKEIKKRLVLFECKKILQDGNYR